MRDYDVAQFQNGTDRASPFGNVGVGWKEEAEKSCNGAEKKAME